MGEKEVALEYALRIFNHEKDDVLKLVHDANDIYNWLSEKEEWKNITPTKK